MLRSPPRPAGQNTDDEVLYHLPEHPGGVLDRFAPAKLDIVLGEKHDVSAQLAHANLKRNTGPGGGLRENHGPGLTGERL